MKRILGVFSLIILGFILFFGMLIFTKYNVMVSLDEEVKAKWGEVDNQLKRRADLIPNLVNTVKGYAKHEKEIFSKIAEARSRLLNAGNIESKIKANNEISGLLGRLLMIAENYPNLKADKNFLALQDELAGTENRLAVARRRYNEAVKTYNKYIRFFPNNIIAKLFGFSKKPYFEIKSEDRKNPKVEF
jgi:LemA protein